MCLGFVVRVKGCQSKNLNYIAKSIAQDEAICQANANYCFYELIVRQNSDQRHWLREGVEQKPRLMRAPEPWLVARTYLPVGLPHGDGSGHLPIGDFGSQLLPYQVNPGSHSAYQQR